MDETTTLPRNSLAKSAPTAKSDAPSKTTAHLKQFPQAHLRPCHANADWTAGKVLTLDEICDRHVRWVLHHCGGNHVVTARLLGIGRTTLYRYLQGRLKQTQSS
jgi:ActR/RegA family two-component response regulator